MYLIMCNGIPLAARRTMNAAEKAIVSHVCAIEKDGEDFDCSHTQRGEDAYMEVWTSDERTVQYTVERLPF